MRLLAQGDTNAEIARRIFISVNTVKHLSHVRTKLDVDGRSDLVTQATHRDPSYHSRHPDGCEPGRKPTPADRRHSLFVQRITQAMLARNVGWCHPDSRSYSSVEYRGP